MPDDYHHRLDTESAGAKCSEEWSSSLARAILNDTDPVVVLLRFRTSITKDDWFIRRAKLVDDLAEEGVLRARHPASVKPTRSAKQRCEMGRFAGADDCDQLATFAAGVGQLHCEPC
jgi:hypothetical protein